MKQYFFTALIYIPFILNIYILTLKLNFHEQKGTSSLLTKPKKCTTFVAREQIEYAQNQENAQAFFTKY